MSRITGSRRDKHQNWWIRDELNVRDEPPQNETSRSPTYAEIMKFERERAREKAMINPIKKVENNMGSNIQHGKSGSNINQIRMIPKISMSIERYLKDCGYVQSGHNLYVGTLRGKYRMRIFFSDPKLMHQPCAKFEEYVKTRKILCTKTFWYGMKSIYSGAITPLYPHFHVKPSR